MKRRRTKLGPNEKLQELKIISPISAIKVYLPFCPIRKKTKFKNSLLPSPNQGTRGRSPNISFRPRLLLWSIGSRIVALV
jgi:hypothetical protein